MINRQDVAGNLGADAEFKEVGENRFAVNFRIASNSRYLGKDGQVVEHTEWFRIRFYCSQRAANEFFRNRLVKGALVYASGRTMTDTYTTRDGEQKESRYVDCEAQNVHVLRDAKTDQPAAAPSAPQSRSAPKVSTPAPKPPESVSHVPAAAPPSTARVDLMNFDA